MLTHLLWVCLGGALGSGARYLVGVGAAAAFGAEFPFGTLIVNAIGAFLIAIVAALSGEAGPISMTGRLFLATGVMGGFTTYSAFNLETLTLYERGALGLAALNVAATLGVCLIAGVLGALLGARLLSLLA